MPTEPVTVGPEPRRSRPGCATRRLRWMPRCTSYTPSVRGSRSACRSSRPSWRAAGRAADSPDPRPRRSWHGCATRTGSSKQSSRRLARTRRSPIRSFRPRSTGCGPKASSCAPRSPRPASPPAVPRRQPQSCRRRRCGATSWRLASQRSSDSLAAKERELATQAESIAALEAATAASARRTRPSSSGSRASCRRCVPRWPSATRSSPRHDRRPRPAVVAAPEPVPSLQPELDRVRAEVARAENRLGRAETEAEYYRATLGQRDEELAEASVVSRRAGERTAALEAELANLQSRLADTEQRLVGGDARPRPHRGRGAARAHGGGPRAAGSKPSSRRCATRSSGRRSSSRRRRCSPSTRPSAAGSSRSSVAELRRELTDRDSRLAQATAEAAWLEQELEAKIAAEAIDEGSASALRPERRRVQPARSRRHRPRRGRVRRARGRPLRGRQARAVAPAGRPQPLRVSRSRLKL